MQLTDYALIAAMHVMVVATPGPATLAVPATSAERGRPAGLALAAGVLTGMMVWAVAGGFGMGAVMAAHAWAADALRIAGGCYLLFLALKAARAFRAGGDAPRGGALRGGPGRQYLLGLGIHLTNPKAILFWSSIFAAVGPAAKTAAETGSIIVMCAAIGTLIIGGYALLFSTPRAMRAWARAARPLNAAVAGLFGAAGASLLLSRAAGAP